MNNRTKIKCIDCDTLIETVRPCKNYGVLLRIDDCGEPTLLCLKCAENQGYIAWFSSSEATKNEWK